MFVCSMIVCNMSFLTDCFAVSICNKTANINSAVFAWMETIIAQKITYTKRTYAIWVDDIMV